MGSEMCIRDSAPSIPHGPPRLYHHCTAITSVYIPASTPYLPPRAITPVYSFRLSHQSYPSTIPRTSGYHTRHSSSYFIVYLSPAFTPPLVLHLHHHRAPHATTYSTYCKHVRLLMFCARAVIYCVNMCSCLFFNRK